MHTPCTRHAHAMHTPCTRRAHAVHMPCTCRAHDVRAHDVHTACTRCAHAMHMHMDMCMSCAHVHAHVHVHVHVHDMRMHVPAYPPRRSSTQSTASSSPRARCRRISQTCSPRRLTVAPALDDDSAASARVAWLKAHGMPSHPGSQPRPLSSAGRSHAAPASEPNQYEDPLSTNRYAVGRETHWEVP